MSSPSSSTLTSKLSQNSVQKPSSSSELSLHSPSSSLPSSHADQPDLLHFPILREIISEARRASVSIDLDVEEKENCKIGTRVHPENDDDDTDDVDAGVTETRNSSEGETSSEDSFQEASRQPMTTLCFLPPIPEEGGPIGSVSLPHPFMLIMESQGSSRDSGKKGKRRDSGTSKVTKQDASNSITKKLDEIQENMNAKGVRGFFGRSQSLACSSSSKHASSKGQVGNHTEKNETSITNASFSQNTSTSASSSNHGDDDNNNKRFNRSKSTVTWFDHNKRNRNVSENSNDFLKTRNRRNTLFERRKSVLVTLFGEAESYRRYSEDLRPKEEDSGSESVQEETLRVIFYQVFIPFLIAGFDNVGAGIILDHVQHWTVFKTIPELFILVASFLGLKGNLEMTLAARLATMANMGQLDKKENRWRIFLGNLTLVQGQAIVVAFLAAIIAIFVNYFKEPNFDMDDCLLLLLTGLTTASITGVAMASLMVCATILARKIGINPDNVSALIASIMGDISAIGLLAFSAKFFYEGKEYLIYVGPVVITFYLILLPIMLGYARKNQYTRAVVGTGWFPIITAMVISSVAGFVFDIAVGFFETIAVVQPIINGVGGNLIAVQASRISTYFHLRCPLGQLPTQKQQHQSRKQAITCTDFEHQDQGVEKTYRKTCPTPFVAFLGNREYSVMTIVL